MRRALTIVGLTAAMAGTAAVRADEVRQDPIISPRAPYPEGSLRQAVEALRPYGIKPSFTYLGEPLANVSGGTKRGSVYEGRADFGIDADLQKLFGWDATKFHANVLAIHGRSLSREYIGNLLLVSGMEALAHTRLYEFWIEHAFGKNLAVRAGQLAADVDFINSKYADVFVNSTFGWPAITGYDIPAGGPAPPLSAVGIRAKATLSDQYTLLVAAYDGNSAGRGTGDPQDRNDNGLNFRINDPPLLIGELQYSYKLDSGRPGTLKLGTWIQTDRLDDQRFAQNGIPLGTPGGMGLTPLRRRGGVGPYAVIEQMLVPSSHEGKGLGVFGRINGTQSDRNLIDFYADGGLNLSGYWQARPEDKIAVGVAYARIGTGSRGFDGDMRTSGTPTAVRSYEAAFELTYQAQIRQGLSLQPDVQYIVHPGGGLTNPLDPAGGRIRNAVMIGARITLKLGERDPESLQ